MLTLGSLWSHFGLTLVLLGSYLGLTWVLFGFYLGLTWGSPCAYWSRDRLMAAPAPLLQVKQTSQKTNSTNISPTSENKRPKTQSDRAVAVQMLFATFYKNANYH
jgi:hypothetical protein